MRDVINEDYYTPVSSHILWSAVASLQQRMRRPSREYMSSSFPPSKFYSVEIDFTQEAVMEKKAGGNPDESGAYDEACDELD